MIHVDNQGCNCSICQRKRARLDAKRHAVTAEIASLLGQLPHDDRRPAAKDALAIANARAARETDL